MFPNMDHFLANKYCKVLLVLLKKYCGSFDCMTLLYILANMHVLRKQFSHSQLGAKPSQKLSTNMIFFFHASFAVD